MSMTVSTPASPELSADGVRRVLLAGYARSDGRKGIRNVVAVAYLVECAHHVAREIVAQFRAPPRLGDAAPAAEAP
ncbi:UxaA family hydrolase, partial [Burkholderia pseudomallei]